MRRAVIAVTTANRPKILDRCLATAVADSEVAKGARWIVLDNSAPEHCIGNREIIRSWIKRGLEVTYIDKAVEDEISNSLPLSSSRNYFSHLTARPSTYRIPGSRNLALLIGLSLEPELLFFMDDDIVPHHGEACFFDWCATNIRGESYIAAPRKRGICDMSYPNRLLRILERDDWRQFLSPRGLSAEPELWFSPANPLWKRDPGGEEQESRASAESEIGACRPKRVLSTQFLVIRDRGGEWLPFPRGHDEDIHWSFLQSAIHGTPLLSVRGVFVQHFPPAVGHLSAEAIVSNVMGRAITRAFKKVGPAGTGLAPITSAECFRDVLDVDIREDVFLLLAIEASLRQKTRTCASDAKALQTLSKIESTLVDAKNQLQALNARHFAREWLSDFDERRSMFSALRRDEGVQKRIRHVLSGRAVPP